MRVIIAGTRDLIIHPRDFVKIIKESRFTITEVVSGHGGNIDLMGERWGIVNEMTVKQFPAHWDIYGKKAGPIRNREMSEYAEALILIWTGDSRTSPGSANMLHHAELNNLIIFNKIWKK